MISLITSCLNPLSVLGYDSSAPILDYTQAQFHAGTVTVVLELLPAMPQICNDLGLILGKGLLL